MLGSLLAALGLADKKPKPVPPAPAGEVSASAVVAESAAGSHVLTIDGYSNVKALVRTGKCIKSDSFAVGGHRWHIRYFPNGEGPDTAGYIGVYLVREHEAGGADVSARFEFSLLDHAGEPVLPWYGVNDGKPHTWKADGSSSGHAKFIKRSQIEGTDYLRDDCFRVRCDVVVSKGTRTEERDDDDDATAAGLIVVPPPDMGRDLRKLLRGGEGSDVSFEVDGETFLAHRYILAARSPVFMAELYGPMKETAETCVRIDDMEARVFKLLLEFMYTDSLPAEMVGNNGDTMTMVMSQHLLVAADRYGLERLKLICEDNLCRCIDTSTVATTLVLAEQHSCQGLKKACFQFLKFRSNLKAALATDGFQHLTSSCPNVVEELLDIAVQKIVAIRN